MIVVGIDVSLSATGVAVVSQPWQEPSSWDLRRVKSPDLGAGLLQMRKRIRRAVDGILEVLPYDPPDLVVIEKPLPARGGFQSLQLERAAVYWMLVDQLIPRAWAVVDVHPKTRAKIATGNGNAGKREVLAAVRGAFPSLKVADDNVADAVALAAAGSHWLGSPLVEYSVKQMEGLAAVAWPVTEGKK